MKALTTDKKLQKRLAVGAVTFVVAWLVAHIAVAVIASLFLTGFAIYTDRREKLLEEQHVGDVSEIDKLAKQLVKKKPKAESKQSTTAKKQASHKDPKPSKPKPKKQQPQDPNLACLVKGHVHGITNVDISDDARLLATASKDGIRVFHAPGLLSKPASYTYARIPVGGDEASAMSISNCGAYVIFTNSLSRKVNVWEVQPFSNGKVHKKPVEMVVFDTDHNAKIDFVRFVTSGARPYILTACSSKEDTTIRLWTKKGKKLSTFDTKRLRTNSISVSADGRFIAAASITSEVAIFEVCRDKDHVFQKVKPAMILKGRAQVLDVTYGSFPNGFHNVATCLVRARRIRV